MFFQPRWLKLDTGILQDEKIQLMRTLPQGSDLFVMWVGLLCLAMKSPHPGVIEVSEGQPYDERMLAEVLGLPLPIIRLGMRLFNDKKFAMLDGNVVVNFPRYQSLVKVERAREKTRERVARWRKRRKSGVASKKGCNAAQRYRNVTVTPEREREKEKKKEKKKERIAARPKSGRKVAPPEPLSDETLKAWVVANRQALVDKMREEFNGARKVKVTVSKATDKRDFSAAHRSGAPDVVDRQRVTVEEFREVVRYHETRRWGNGTQYSQSFPGFCARLDSMIVQRRQRKGVDTRGGKKDWGFANARVEA